MSKNRRSIIKPQRFCLFCGGPGLSKTHIWPDWLNELLRPGDKRQVTLQNKQIPEINSVSIKQGSVFSQKPYLACKKCNNGWMGLIETKMGQFAKPLFLNADAELDLTDDQTQTFAMWSALIITLSEFIGKPSDICIPKSDRKYLYKFRRPPEDTWTIAAFSSTSKKWSAQYRHHAMHHFQYNNVFEYMDMIYSRPRDNAQICSFGMGSIFIHAMVSPMLTAVSDFRAFVSNSGGQILWPHKNRPFWFFPKRTPKFPTQTVLTDETADALDGAFKQRLEAQKPGSV